MKRWKIIALTAVLAVAMLGCLTACGRAVQTNYTYDNADRYTAGDRQITETVDVVEIDYLSGDVTLARGTGEAVTVKETANRDLEEKEMVHTWLEGTTLHVKYCASDEGYDFSGLEKKLEITVPKDAELKQADLDLAVGNVTLDCFAREIDLDLAAGNVTLTQSGECDSIDIDAAAGNIDAKLGNVGKLQIDMSAGDAKIEADAIREVAVDAAGGSCEFRFAAVPQETTLDLAAGDLTIYMPETAGLTVEADLAGNEPESDIPYASMDGKYIFGSGENHMKIDMGAGGLKFLKL